MSFLAPWALGFLATLPVITALYFLKLRRQRQVVSSTLLWQQAVREMRANTPFQRLRTSLLLLLQLLLATLIALALARPFLPGLARLAPRRVVILDASASMNARDGSGRTRFERARKEALDLAGTSEGDGRTMILLAGARPRVAQPFTSDRRAIENALAQARPEEGPGDLARAISLALAITRDDDARDVVVVSDAAAPPLPSLVAEAEGVRLVSVGGEADNVGIVSFDAVAVAGSRSDWEVFVGVANQGAAARKVRVSVSVEGRVVGVRSVAVSPRSTGGVVVPVAAEGGSEVTAELEGSDPFDLDDRVYGVLPRPTSSRVAVVSASGTIDPWLRRALAAQPAIDLREYRVGDPLDPGEHDLVIFDGVTPAEVTIGAYLFLDPGAEVRGEGELLFRMGEPVAYPTILDWESQHPLLRYVTFADVHMKEARPIVPLGAGRSLAEIEDGAVIVADLTSSVRYAAVGFDYRHSDLPFRAAFPILLGNLVGSLPFGQVQEGSLSVPAGQSVRLAIAPSYDGRVVVEGPTGEEREVLPVGGTFLFDGADRTGIYRVRADGATAYEFGVSLLSPEESNLSPRLQVERPGEVHSTVAANTSSVKLELFPWLLALCLIVIVGEWLVYHRRMHA